MASSLVRPPSWERRSGQVSRAPPGYVTKSQNETVSRCWTRKRSTYVRLTSGAFVGVAGDSCGRVYLTRAQGRNSLVAPPGRQERKDGISNQDPGVRLEFEQQVLLSEEGEIRRPWSGVARWRVRGRDLSGNRVELVQWCSRAWSA